MALTNHPFNLLTVCFVAAVVDTIGIEQENVPWTQQRELGDIGGVRVALPGVQREIPIPIRMIFRDVQAERQKLHHTALIYLHELPIFRGEDEWRDISEIHQSKIAKRVYFSLKHGRYILVPLFLTS